MSEENKNESKNNNQIIILSKFEGDVGHTSCYNKKTNTKIEEEILNTNKSEFSLFRNKEKTITVKGDEKLLDQTQGNVDKELFCGGNKSQNILVDGNEILIDKTKGNVDKELVCEGNKSQNILVYGKEILNDKTKGNVDK